MAGREGAGVTGPTSTPLTAQEVLAAFGQITTALRVQQTTNGQLAEQLAQLTQAATARATEGQGSAEGSRSSAVPKLLSQLKPPSYAGEKDSDGLDTWVFQMNQYFDTTPGLSEKHKVLTAGLLLKGQAATWWRDVSQLPTAPKSWGELTAALELMFMPVERSKLARDRLAEAKQRERDSLTAYTTYMRRLFLSIPSIADDEKLDRYVRGLLPHLRKEVMVRDPRTVEEAITYATRFDSLRRATGSSRVSSHWPRSHSHEEPGDPMELGYAEKSKGGYKGKGYGRDRPQKPKTDECFNCGELGHYARDCPKPKKGPEKGQGKGQGHRPRSKTE